MLCVSRLLLRKEGMNFYTTAEFEIVRTIKEKACYLANNPQKEETVETEKYQYILPDGSTLEVSIYYSKVTYTAIIYKGKEHCFYNKKNSV